MNIISIKLDEGMLKRMDALLKENNYSTRTEFIRSTLREKMTQLEKDALIKEVMKLKGSVKTKTTDAELRRIRIEVGEEYMREHGLK
jgi:metal-responsive CopG/Arc/MetJ family transcriptional regulator